MSKLFQVAFRAMGTTVEMGCPTEDALDVGGEQTANEAFAYAHLEINRLESLLSRFLPDSDVTNVNNHPGRWVPVAPETSTVLKLAADAYHRTNGLFNPCLGAAMEAIGYKESFVDTSADHRTVATEKMTDKVAPMDAPKLEAVEPQPRPKISVSQLLATPPYRLAEGDGVWLAPGHKIDLGGIAKGWIVEQAAQVLRVHGLENFVVSAGGDMVCQGTNAGEPWDIGIVNPIDTNQCVRTVYLNNLSLATSGTYRRRWIQNGEPVHHIIDPRTKASAASSVASATVVSPSLVAAEVMAKVSLLLGADGGMRWLDEQKPIGTILVTMEGEVMEQWSS